MNLKAFALAALVAIAQPSAHAASPKASQYYEDALQRYQKQDLKGAIVQLKNALQEDNKLLSAHVLLGKALLGSGQAPAAEAAFEEALRLGVSRSELAVPWAQALVAQGKLNEVVSSQRFPMAELSPALRAQLLLIKATAAGNMGDPSAALKLFQDARGLDPADPERWLAEVPLRISAGQFKEAMALVDKAKTLGPNSAALQYQLASILHAQGDVKGALAAYDQALALQPTLNDARLARAGLLVDLKRGDEATKAVAELVQRTPGEPRVWYLNALLAERAGNAAQVKASFTKITELLDALPLTSMRYRPLMMTLNGQAHYGLGQLQKAQAYFEGVARVQPGSPVVKVLASIQLSEGETDRAIQTLEKYLGTVPNDAQASAMLASAYVTKGDPARAAELSQRALQKGNQPELNAAYGLSLLAMGQAGAAKAQLEIAYKKDPTQDQAAAALIGLYLRSGESAKALPIAQGLVKRQPNNAAFQNLLGVALVAKPDLPAARAALELALKLDQKLQQARLNLARLEMSANNNNQAQTLLAGVLEADEGNTEAMYELGRLAERLNKPAEAQKWLQKGYDVGGIKDLRISLALVDLYMRSGRKAEALKAVQRLTAQAPNSLPLTMTLARVQMASGDMPAARTALAHASRVAQPEAAEQLDIALLQIATGNLPAASAAAGKVLQAQPEDLRALAVMAQIELQQGELSKAEARAQLIQKKAPKLAMGPGLLGDVAMSRKQPAAALEQYRKAHQVEPSTETVKRLVVTQAVVNAKLAAPIATQWLKDYPQDQAVRRLLAELYVKTNELPGAKVQLEALLQQTPQDADTASDLAIVLARLQDPQALTVAEQAVALAPTNIKSLDTAGWIAFQVGKSDRALQLLRDARLRAPDQPQIRYHLGATLAKAGRNREAADELNAALGSNVPFEGRAQAAGLLHTLQ